MNEIGQTVVAEGGVPGEYRGPGPYDIMFVGEAPGPEEVKAGRPFIGPAGRVFEAMRNEAGIDSCYVTNICKVFPGRDAKGKIKAPTKEQSTQWRPYLEAEIREVQPKKVILLGIPACKHVFGGQWKLGDIVGTTQVVDGVEYVAAYHPASFIYNQGTVYGSRIANTQRRILRDALGMEPVSYDYLVLPPNREEGMAFIDLETSGKTDPRVAKVEEWSLLREQDQQATLSFESGTLPPRFDTAVFHNAMYDYPLLVRENREWLSVEDIHDTMIMAYVLGYEDLSLKGLSSELFGIQVFDYKNRDKCGRETYNAQDVFLTRRLYDTLGPRLVDNEAYQIDRSIVRVLTRAELFGGYMVNQKKLQSLIGDKQAERERLEQTFAKWYPGINMGSPAQLLEVFPTKDTNAATLKDLGTPEAMVILAWRSVNKDLTTYLLPASGLERFSGLYRLTMSAGDEKDPSEKGGAGTGRLSSYSFNMQNLDPELYQCFSAPTNMMLLRADYSQIELRFMAQLSQDERMIETLRANGDIHQDTADALGIPRQLAKTWNFNRWYWGAVEPQHIAKFFAYKYQIPEDKCLEMLLKQDELYPAWKEYSQSHWQHVLATGMSTTPMGHSRKIHLFKEAEAKRQAGNHPPQSMASYTTKAAMGALDEAYAEGEFEFINQVHDEVHYFVSKDKVKTAKGYVKDVMQEVGNRYLPDVGIDVDVKVAKYWEMKG